MEAIRSAEIFERESVQEASNSSEKTSAPLTSRTPPNEALQLQILGDQNIASCDSHEIHEVKNEARSTRRIYSSISEPTVHQEINARLRIHHETVPDCEGLVGVWKFWWWWNRFYWGRQNCSAALCWWGNVKREWLRADPEAESRRGEQAAIGPPSQSSFKQKKATLDIDVGSSGEGLSDPLPRGTECRVLIQK
jgi:hypothetical protein